MVFLNILKYSYIYNVIYIRLKLVFTIWMFFRNGPTGKKTETCNIRFITSRARRVNSEKTFNPTWKMQNDKNVKWRNPRRYSGLFRILRFEIFLLFIHFPTPQKFRIKLKSERNFFIHFFRIRCETRLFMLSNQLAKMLMMPYSRCNYWVTLVKQLQLIRLLEFYLIYHILDR